MKNYFSKLLTAFRNTETQVWHYYLFNFLCGLSFYIAVLVPFYTQWGKISLTQVQLLQSWLMFWIFVLNFPTGVIADRFGRKTTVALGCFFGAVSSIFEGTFAGFVPFLIGEFIAALSIALISGAANALIFDALKEKNQDMDSKKVFGRGSALSQLGAIIAAPLGSIVAAKLGMNFPMLLTAIPYTIGIFIVLTMQEPKINEEAEKKSGILTIAKESLLFFNSNRSVFKLVLNDALVFSGAYFLLWIYQPMLTSLGLAVIYFGFIRSLYAIAGMITTSNLHLTEKLFGSDQKFLLITALVVIVSLTSVFIYPHVVTVSLAVILLGGLATARTIAVNASINHIIPANQRATVLSAVSMISTIILVILNPLVGYIADHALRVAFLVAAVLPTVGTIFLSPDLPKPVESVKPVVKPAVV